MSKSSSLQKEKNRFFLFNKYFYKWKYIKDNFKNINYSRNDLEFFEKLNFNLSFQNLKRNSNRTRLRNRCFVTGRTRGVLRRFGLSRSPLKNLACRGYIPGLLKSSW